MANIGALRLLPGRNRASRDQRGPVELLEKGQRDSLHQRPAGGLGLAPSGKQREDAHVKLHPGRPGRLDQLRLSRWLHQVRLLS